MMVLKTDLTGAAVVICQKAVLDCAPFEPWSREMRLAIGEDYRDVSMTFKYW
jgi:hypothetical protein